MANIFEELSKREQKLLEQLSICPKVEISGLVDASGIVSMKTRHDPLCSMTLKFNAWRIGTGKLRTDPLTIRRKVSEEELKELRSRINAESIIKILGNISEENIFGSPQAQLLEVIQSNIFDSELNNHLLEMGSPVTLQDEIIGTFNRKEDCYIANISWSGENINLKLSIDDKSDEITTLVQIARTLYENQRVWNDRIRDFAVKELLSLKNETWLEEDELELTEEEFKKRMKLEVITIYNDGSFEFWHNDGELFWGHSILISGNMIDGPNYADIPG